ncbi:MAG TPA: hypothetical protein VFU02_10225 [Polyangiaceae bacterium]|nr:hypothetical protein [Polyangiaceae bacterium]
MQCRAMVVASLLVALAPVRAFADAPPANRGFQLALRTGAAVPFGKVSNDFDLSDFSGVQVPFLVDIGGKPIPELFIAGYIGAAVGGPGGSTADFCDRTDAGCAGFGWRAGAQVQYHFIPGGEVNPWIGYGFGWEAFGLGIVREEAVEDDELDEDDYVAAAVAGYEFAHLMGGADFRLNEIVGVGPFVDVSFGRYTRVGFDNGEDTRSEDIEDSDQATHGWVAFGVRVVFFP